MLSNQGTKPTNLIGFIFLTIAMIVMVAIMLQPVVAKESSLKKETIPNNHVKVVEQKEIPPPTIDTNNDGIPDAWDRDKDGRPDAWDSDGDNLPDKFDNDGDGKPDKAPPKK